MAREAERGASGWVSQAKRKRHEYGRGRDHRDALAEASCTRSIGNVEEGETQGGRRHTDETEGGGRHADEKQGGGTQMKPRGGVGPQMRSRGGPGTQMRRMGGGGTQMNGEGGGDEAEVWKTKRREEARQTCRKPNRNQ